MIGIYTIHEEDDLFIVKTTEQRVFFSLSYFFWIVIKVSLTRQIKNIFVISLFFNCCY